MYHDEAECTNTEGSYTCLYRNENRGHIDINAVITKIFITGSKLFCDTIMCYDYPKIILNKYCHMILEKHTP